MESQQLTLAGLAQRKRSNSRKNCRGNMPGKMEVLIALFLIPVMNCFVQILITMQPNIAGPLARLLLLRSNSALVCKQIPFPRVVAIACVATKTVVSAASTCSREKFQVIEISSVKKL